MQVNRRPIRVGSSGNGTLTTIPPYPVIQGSLPRPKKDPRPLFELMAKSAVLACFAALLIGPLPLMAQEGASSVNLQKQLAIVQDVSASTETRADAARKIGGANSDDALLVPSLYRVFRNRNNETLLRANVLYAIARITVKDQKLDDFFQGIVADTREDAVVRIAAARGLADRGPRAALAIPVLVNAIIERKSSPHFRNAAISALAVIDEHDATARRVLKQLLLNDNEDSKVRASAAVALASRSSLGQSVVPDIVRIVRMKVDNSGYREELRHAMTRALSTLKPDDGAIPDLLEIFEDPMEVLAVRRYALLAIGNTGHAAKDIAPRVVAQLRDPLLSDDIIGEYPRVISAIASPTAAKSILKMVADSTEDQRTKQRVAQIDSMLME